MDASRRPAPPPLRGADAAARPAPPAARGEERGPAAPPAFPVPHRLAMGLSALAPDEPWLHLDADLGADLLEKRRLLASERAQVFVEREGSRPAQREVLGAVLDELARHHAGDYAIEADRVFVRALGGFVALEATGDPPLVAAARLVQEDLCVMERADGAWRLTAGVVCFPTRWDLPSKLGLSLAAIHDVVPGYAPTLEAAADRFFDGMRPGRIFRRTNWSLLEDPTLFQPARVERSGPDPAIDARHAGDRVWLRTEVQTLRRLPATDAILFTIRVHRQRLREVAGEPEAAARLLGCLSTMDAALQHYKALPAIRDAVVGWLESVRDGRPPAPGAG